METDSFIVVMSSIGGFIVLLVVYFWSKTTQAVKIIETEAVKCTNLVSKTTKEKIAEMKLQGKKLEIASVNQKNAYDYENYKYKLKVELSLQENLLERENIIQSGENTRANIQSDALVSMAQLNNEIQKFQIQTDLLMNDRVFEFKHKELTSGIELERFRIKNQLESTKLQLEQRKFEALTGFEAVKIQETHKDRRLESSLNSTFKLQKESLNSLAEREQKRLEFDERKLSKTLDFKRQKEQHKTTRQRIKGKTEMITKGCLQAGNLAASQMSGVVGFLGNVIGNSLSASPSVCVVEEIDDNDQMLSCL